MAWVGNARIFMIIELVVAICGLTFSLLTRNAALLLTIAFTISMIYMIIMVICAIAGKVLISGSIETVVELVLATLLVIFAIIMVADGSSKDVWAILAIVAGFILPSLFIITSCDRL